MQHDHARTLADFIRSLPDFAIPAEIDGDYRHMPATLADAVLQAGVKYSTVVKPRVRKLLAEHPQARTMSDLMRLLETVGAGALLNWTGKKVRTLEALAEFLHGEGVETEEDLSRWLESEGNCRKLLFIKGIGPKTLDYMKILVGQQTVAIDMHLSNFLKLAGIDAGNDYNRAKAVILETAKLLDCNPAYLDHGIWQYMSSRKDPKRPGSGSPPKSSSATSCSAA